MRNMRRGFTMIELIFVILIIGILAVVALPRFLESANQAHNAKVDAFVGTLNRTVGPTLWAKSIAEGKSGLIVDYCGDMPTYTEVPVEVSVAADCELSLVAGEGASGSFTPAFVDGNTTHSPRWDYNSSI